MKSKKGFTLVELLAVIAILAILVIMALPAVLRMFNSARKDSFTNEVNTVIRTARQQYLLSGGTDTTWSNAEGSTKSLDLTGNSQLRYYVKMNNEGKITKLQVTNGDFQYNKSGIIDVAESSDVQTVSELAEGEIIDASGKNIEFVSRSNPNSITRGDEIAIDTEHFYVVSTNSTETVLLAKYNLYVGEVYDYDSTPSGWRNTYIKTITASDEGYGLQNSTAKGHNVGGSYPSTTRVGGIPFASSAYWYDAANNRVLDEYNHKFDGTSPQEYEPIYIYNSNLSNNAPVIRDRSTATGTTLYTDNGYTIAYYVNNYVNTLKSLGAPNSITGRLLVYEEAYALGCRRYDEPCLSSTPSWLFNTNFYLGSAVNSNVMYINIARDYYHYIYSDLSGITTSGYTGVRPAIIIPTSELK